MSDAPLNKLVAQINGHLERFEHAGPEDDEQRISVGLLLIAARDSVQRGKWYDWLKANIKRSIRDCQKAIAVAHAPDPHRKLAEQRKKNRQYARRHRQSLHRRAENIIDLLRSSGAARPAAAAQNAIGLREDDAPPLPFVGRLEAVKPGANPSD